MLIHQSIFPSPDLEFLLALLLLCQLRHCSLMVSEMDNEGDNERQHNDVEEGGDYQYFRTVDSFGEAKAIDDVHFVTPSLRYGKLLLTYLYNSMLLRYVKGFIE